jgi:hypothetical protein
LLLRMEAKSFATLFLLELSCETERGSSHLLLLGGRVLRVCCCGLSGANLLLHISASLVPVGRTIPPGEPAAGGAGRLYGKNLFQVDVVVTWREGVRF